jgi:hypothetical protein
VWQSSFLIQKIKSTILILELIQMMIVLNKHDGGGASGPFHSKHRASTVDCLRLRRNLFGDILKLILCMHCV